LAETLLNKHQDHTMTTTPKPRSSSGVPGVKVLLAAVSLTATIGGWAWITSQPAQSSQPAANSDAVMASLNLPALPTVVPPPANLGGTLANTSAQTVNPAPQPPAILRSVTLPSFPLFSTRSSR
jgi:hypothetical protein